MEVPGQVHVGVQKVVLGENFVIDLRLHELSVWNVSGELLIPLQSLSPHETSKTLIMADGTIETLPTWARVDLGHGLVHSRFARHIRVEQPSHSIKGKYIIGVTAPDHFPPLFDAPVEQVVRQSSASASFETKGSAIAAEIWIMGDPKVEEKIGPDQHRLGLEEASPAKGLPVSVSGKSSMGRVQLSVVSIRQPLMKRPDHSLDHSHDLLLTFFGGHCSHDLRPIAHCIFEQRRILAPSSFTCLPLSAV